MSKTPSSAQPNCEHDKLICPGALWASELSRDYQRIIKEVLACDPIPASQRPDDRLEPPWEVIARIRGQLSQAEARAQEFALAEGRRQAELSDIGARTSLLNTAEVIVMYQDALQIARTERAKAEQAEARLAAMEKDAERLDWLDRRNAALNKHYGTEYRWKLVLSHNVTRLMLGNFDVDLHDAEPGATGLPSCRAAIDAAIAALAEGK